jgi:hypothetical protein
MLTVVASRRRLCLLRMAVPLGITFPMGVACLALNLGTGVAPIREAGKVGRVPAPFVLNQRRN